MSLDIQQESVILGIESSCDETSAAVLRNGELASVVVSSQFFHNRFGGVVPELASRAHVRSILPIVKEAYRQAGIESSALTAIAATYAPGLMGSLLVGLNFAKGLALGLDIPLIGVHHIEAHIFSALLEAERPDLPFVALVVSGGHTLLLLVQDVGKYRFLGETLDDAAGEAFDKVGKMLGLPYPAGPEIDKLAKAGDANYAKFPRAMMNEENFDFSFSGLKTSVLYWLKKHESLAKESLAKESLAKESLAKEPLAKESLAKEPLAKESLAKESLAKEPLAKEPLAKEPLAKEPLAKESLTKESLTNEERANIAASFQRAIVDVLVTRTLRAAEICGAHNIVCVGGVSANSELRARFTQECSIAGKRFFTPRPLFSTDNAAMIAMLGALKLERGQVSDLSLTALPRVPLAHRPSKVTV